MKQMKQIQKIKLACLQDEMKEKTESPKFWNFRVEKGY